MTFDEFDLAVSKTRLKPHTIAVARAVLVEGLGLTQAGNAAEPRMHKQQVAVAVARIEREHRKIIGSPQGWRCITLTLPWHGEEWDAAEDLQSRAFERAGLKLPNAISNRACPRAPVERRVIRPDRYLKDLAVFGDCESTSLYEDFCSDECIDTYNIEHDMNIKKS
jgi:hypothetical protein